MPRHPPLEFTEENPNPRFRPSVDHLITQLRESKTLNRDDENVLFVIEDLVDHYFVREHKPRYLYRLWARIYGWWVTEVVHEPHETFPVSSDHHDRSVSRRQVLAALAAHKVEGVTATEEYICTCGRISVGWDVYQTHERRAVMKILFPPPTAPEHKSWCAARGISGICNCGANRLKNRI